jgi:hypothetical protein
MPAMETAAVERYSVAPEVLLQEVQGELVLLNLQTERFFGLNVVGLRVWQLVAEGNSRRSVIDLLESEFEVGRDRLEQDVTRLLAELLAAGLLLPATA